MRYGTYGLETNIIGIALDMDNGKLYFAKDDTWQNSGDPTSGSTGTGAIDVWHTKPHLIGYTPYAANTDGLTLVATQYINLKCSKRCQRLRNF